MPRLLVDFDTIHRHSRGWHDGTTYDPPFPDALAALQTLTDRGYEIVIFSTRPATQIAPWLERYGFPPYRITDRKEPALAMVDGHAVQHLDWPGTLSELARRYPPSLHGVVGSASTPGASGRKEPHDPCRSTA